MRNDLHMRRAAGGPWYFGATNEIYGPINPNQQQQDSFFAPGEEAKMIEQITREEVAAEYRKKFIMLALGCAVGLVIALALKSTNQPRIGG